MDSKRIRLCVLALAIVASAANPLRAQATKNGWIILRMERDWKEIFAFE